MPFEKIGDWQRVRHLINRLDTDMKKAQQLSLKRWGLKAEGLAKGHISKQDLGWRPLRPSTIARKIRKGYSEDILVETSTYFQSITSWVDGDTAYAGVKKEKRYSGKDGTEYVTDIAYLHEFGSETRGVPARPLWKPTFKEAMAWHWKNNKPEEIFLNIVKKY